MEKKKRKTTYRIWIVFFIILVILAIFFLQKNHFAAEESVTENTSEVIRTTIYNKLTTSSYVETAVEEKKELHATYYFEEIYFSENQLIEEGENILKYTNGTYLVAPYNCVITNLSIPESGEVCTNQHYITIQSTDTLKLSMQIEEDEKDTILIGQEAKIVLDALPEKELDGIVTQIGNTATYSSSGSTFEVIIEFQNDGEIRLGMTAEGSVILEKAEDVIAVAKEAVTTKNNQKLVTVQQSDGRTAEVEVETGIENEAYVEIKSGLTEGQIIIIPDSDDAAQTALGNQMQRNQRVDRTEMDKGMEKQMPEQRAR